MAPRQPEDLVTASGDREPWFPIARVAESLYGLKTTKRAGWTARGPENRESVADHSLGAYILGLLYLPEEEPRWKGYEKREILDTILIHDFAEAYVGDLLPHQKNQAAREREEETFDNLGVLST